MWNAECKQRPTDNIVKRKRLLNHSPFSLLFIPISQSPRVSRKEMKLALEWGDDGHVLIHLPRQTNLRNRIPVNIRWGICPIELFYSDFPKTINNFFIFGFSETLIEFNEISLPLCNAFFFGKKRGKKLDQRLNEILRGVVGSLVVTWCNSDKICSTSQAIHVRLQVQQEQRWASRDFPRARAEIWKFPR